MKYAKTAGEDGEMMVTIEGTLDAVTAPELREVVDELVHAQCARVKLDLSGLRLIDSSGVGVIVSLFKRVKAFGGQVSIVGVRDQPLAIFRLLRLDRVFPM